MRRSLSSLFSRWNLTPKLLLAFLLTAILPVLAASLFSLNYFYGVAFEDARRTLAKELGVARHVLEERGHRLELDTKLASRENVVALNLSLGLTAPVLDYLETLRTDRRWALAALVTAKGGLLEHPSVSAHPHLKPEILLADRLETSRQQGGISFQAPTDDGRVLLVSLVPVPDELGTTNYYLLTALDPGSSEPGGMLEEIQRMVSGPVVFGTQRGLQGAPPETPVWDSATWPTNLPPEGALVQATSRGASYLFGFSSFGTQTGTPLAWIGVSFSLDSFREATNTAAGGLILIAALFTLLSSVAALLFSRGLTRPLLTMARQASAWTAGQGVERLTVTTHDEAGTLGRAFNEALDRLGTTFDSLRKTQNYLKNIFNSLTSILVSIDAEGTVQEWNLAAEKFNGTKADEAIGRKVHELSPLFGRLEATAAKAVSSRQPQFLQRSLGQGHDRRTFDLCLYPLVWNGVSGVVIRVDDITETLRKDRQLQQAQKMETVGTLTEGIAHNFNNLLTGITGTVSLVALELDQERRVDPDQLRLRISMIEESARKASEIVRRLMALGRGSPGEFSAVDLVAVIKDIVKTSQMVLDKTVEVELQVTPQAAHVLGDKSQLEQSLLNLMINASHAMTIMRPREEPAGGTIRVTLQSISAFNDFLATHPGATQSDYWLIQVQDRGVGIKPENLSQVFDPFFTTKDSDKGSGLGLAMVYSSIRQHNGFVDVYSEVGRGTTFSLYLPRLDDSAANTLHRGTDHPARLRRGHGLILVVDDELVVQTTAVLILQACGYEAVTANNGLEALEVYKSRGSEIRAVLLDSSMPKLSGAETLDALKVLDSEVKVVMSSGLFNGNLDPETRQGPNLRFLPKPYSLAELSAVLDDLLTP